MYLESRYASDVGIKPQAGFKLSMTKNSTVQAIFDFYFGPVMYLRYQKHITYAERYGSCSRDYLTWHDPPFEENTFGPRLGFNIGINFTLAF